MRNLTLVILQLHSFSCFIVSSTNLHNVLMPIAITVKRESSKVRKILTVTENETVQLKLQETSNQVVRSPHCNPDAGDEA